MQASMAAHLLPLPEYPSLHAQVPLTQIALSSLHATPTGQFSVNVQVLPEPVKPLLHEQRFEPLTIEHLASLSHPPLFFSQSFFSLQETPSPENPVLHLQERVPAPFLVHCAFSEQPPFGI
jgi:hypothetical protein